MLHSITELARKFWSLGNCLSSTAMTKKRDAEVISMLLLLEPYLYTKIEVCPPFFMLRIMVKVNAYILSVHSSSGFYEELHQIVVTLPSRQVKRLKLGDLFGIISGSRGLNLVVGWTFPSFELFLGKALIEQIF